MASPPPLSLLRSFEAAARRQSFRRAAEEMHVTPAAISQQMRALEAHLGVRLFERQARGLKLTEAGREYLGGVAFGLSQIDEATRRLSQPRRAGRLTVRAQLSFALHWLTPRLPGFRARHPEIDLRLHLEPPGPGSEIDVLIEFGPGPYPGMSAEIVMGDWAYPACSPALLHGAPPPWRRGDLLRRTLLHDSTLRVEEASLRWSTWLRHGDIEAPPRGASIHLPGAELTIQAALLGQGVAVVRHSLVSDYLASGRLVRPVADARATDYAYWFVTALDRASDPNIVALRDWMREHTGPSLDEAS